MDDMYVLRFFNGHQAVFTLLPQKTDDDIDDLDLAAVL